MLFIDVLFCRKRRQPTKMCSDQIKHDTGLLLATEQSILSKVRGDNQVNKGPCWCSGIVTVSKFCAPLTNFLCVNAYLCFMVSFINIPYV